MRSGHLTVPQRVQAWHPTVDGRLQTLGRNNSVATILLEFCVAASVMVPHCCGTAIGLSVSVVIQREVTVPRVALPTENGEIQDGQNALLIHCSWAAASVVLAGFLLIGFLLCVSFHYAKVWVFLQI